MHRITDRSINLFWPSMAMLLMAGCWLADIPTVTAFGGNIEVVLQDAQVRVLGEVTFGIAIESKAHIEEVRLNFRNANNGPWNYIYLDFDPSTSIETSYTLDVSNGNYIPPGAEVQYFYTVRDSAGNIKKSDTLTVLYLDPRFDWQSTDIGAFMLLWHDRSADSVEMVRNSLRNPIAKVENLLGVEVKAPMRGVIYNSRREAAAGLPRLSPTLDERQIFHGFAFADWNLFTGVGLGVDLITHEIAHLLLSQATESATRRTPAWLNEGFASYVEPGSRAISSRLLHNRRPEDMPLRAMGSVPGRPNDIRYFYDKSESVVDFLIETYGENDFRSFLSRLNEGQVVDLALKATYGFDQTGLEEHWLGVAGGNSLGENDDGNLFLQMESIFLGGLVLLVTTVLMARFMLYRLLSKSRADYDLDSPYG